MSFNFFSLSANLFLASSKLFINSFHSPRSESDFSFIFFWLSCCFISASFSFLCNTSLPRPSCFILSSNSRTFLSFSAYRSPSSLRLFSAASRCSTSLSKPSFPSFIFFLCFNALSSIFAFISFLNSPNLFTSSTVNLKISSLSSNSTSFSLNFFCKSSNFLPSLSPLLRMSFLISSKPLNGEAEAPSISSLPARSFSASASFALNSPTIFSNPLLFSPSTRSLSLHSSRSFLRASPSFSATCFTPSTFSCSLFFMSAYRLSDSSTLLCNSSTLSVSLCTFPCQYLTLAFSFGEVMGDSARDQSLIVLSSSSVLCFSLLNLPSRSSASFSTLLNCVSTSLLIIFMLSCFNLNSSKVLLSIPPSTPTATSSATLRNFLSSSSC